MEEKKEKTNPIITNEQQKYYPKQYPRRKTWYFFVRKSFKFD